MFKRLFQAATITFLLNLLAYMSLPDENHQGSLSSSVDAPNLMVSWR